MPQVKKMIISVVVIFSLIIMISGCGLVNTLTSMKEKFKGEEEPVVTIDFLDEEQADDVPLALEYPVDIQNGTFVASLWFSDASGQTLVVEEREIAKVEGIARETINELIKGPDPQSSLLPTIPVGTMLNDINVKDDGLIIVDLSSELINNHIGGSTAEALTVYSIVNTLTQFPTVDRVQLLIDGQYCETLAGHFDISEAISSGLDLGP